jgi:hypothetical protein
VGSYPPVPGPAAAATLAAVRRAWASGDEVVVVSPRPSAAPVVMPLGGAAVGRELAKLGVAHGCQDVVLCLEPGWPFAAGARSQAMASARRRPSARGDSRVARALAQALAGFERASLVVTGDLGVEPRFLAVLWPSVEDVVASSEATASQLRIAGAPGVRAVEPFAGAGLLAPDDEATGYQVVGPLEPAELLVVARGRRFVGLLARKALGRHAPAVRLYLRRLLRPAPTGRH